jgi:predicted permease
VIDIGTVFRSLFRRRRFEDQLSEELRFHIDAYTADLIRSGMSADEASRRARVEFGGVESVREECRRARGLRLADEVMQDVRYGARVMRRAPGFTATAIGTIALCLGANLSIFAVVNAVLLRPLPFPHAERLVRIYNTYPKAGVPDDGASVANYYERRTRMAALAAVSLYREGNALVGEPGSTERERVMRVTPEFFATLGVAPALGRAFVEAETSYETSRVAILSDGLWRERFDADPGIVGRPVRVDGVERLVVGVLPREFRFLSSKARMFFPLASDPEDRVSARRHSGSSSQMVARLAPDVTLEVAQSAIDAQNASAETGTPMAAMMREAGFRSVVAPLQAEHVASVKPMLLIVQAGAMCLLLIGGVNLMNLLLIRATARSKELAVRQAIGGSRARIARQVIVETMLLALSGSAAGFGAGFAGVRLLKALGTDTLPLGSEVAFDSALAGLGAVAAVVLALTLAMPIVWFTMRQPAAALTSESRGATAGAAVQRVRHGFLVAQVALAFALLAGAGLLALSLREVLAISPGFQAANAISGQISLPVRAYPDTPARVGFVDRLMREIERHPGVTAAGVVTSIPFSGRDIKSAITVKGWVPAAGESVRGHYGHAVGGHYFAALGVPLIEGRFLDPSEIARGARHVVVDQEFAQRYWPKANAVGRQLFAGPKAGPDAEAYTVVGVVGSVKHAGLTDAAATGAVFFPYSGRFSADLFVVVRTSGAPSPLAPALRNAVRAVDPGLAVSDVKTMDARIADSLVARRSPAVLAALFGALALFLTAIGTYGVLSYSVTQRRREIAVRMALGARPEDVRRAFASQGLRLIAIGSILGLAAALAAGRAMGSLLFGVPPVHVPTLAAAAAIVFAVTIAACLVPSVRAARVSPMEALNES